MRRVRLEELLGSPDERSGLLEVLARGGVAAIPTDTFYALACDPSSERGVDRIFQIKGRDDGKRGSILHARHLDRLRGRGRAATAVRRSALAEPPTLVLPLWGRHRGLAGIRTLAVRVPAAAAVRPFSTVSVP